MSSEQEFYTRGERSEEALVRRIQVMSQFYLGDEEIIQRRSVGTGEDIIIAWNREKDSRFRLGPLRIGTFKTDTDVSGNVIYDETMWVIGRNEPRKVVRKGKIWNGKMPRVNSEPVTALSVVESRYRELDYLLRKVQSSLPIIHR